ncbi:uncharacterized protein LOC118749046 [Rhagoletis pomonella]|uniref:uncharacterized protein LOC118749046 n=1 Tax=Rhagoletis pomonella TaxID=28610 RepID=UPI00177CEE05|nr:uncharacterized protein LOC118749046 [Rhagoletis pomonella]
MDKETILRLTKAELTDELAKLGLPTSGLKSELQTRLLEHLGLVVGGDDDSVYDEADVSIRSVVGEVGSQRSIFTLRDIEDSLVSFSGNGHPTIEKWLEVFEENALAVNWNNLQKFIYSKQLLKGAAKIFIRSQCGIINWETLKRALIDEFGVQFSAIEVHRQLRNRRKRQGEDLREYLYSLMEIGKPVNLDERSLIEYFIEGIPDTKLGKCNLYQAKTVRELKEQMAIYEKIKSGKPTATGVNMESKKGVNNVSTDEQAAVPRKCYTCGESSHLARSCPQKLKCFKCNQIGHRAAQCPGVKPVVKLEKSNVNAMGNKGFQKSCMGNNLLFKDITLKGFVFSSLIDTGCEICLMRYYTLLMIGDIELSKDKRQLVGIGESELTTLGSFTHSIQVDGLEIEVVFHVTREADINQVDLFVAKDEVQFRRKGRGLPLDEQVTSPGRAKKVNLEDHNQDNGLALIKQLGDICMMAGTEINSKSQVELAHLQQALAARVTDLLDMYSPVKGAKSRVEMKILLTDEHPVYERPRRVPFADKHTIEDQVTEWLREKIIQPSTSDYASPVVLVSKKDGSKRLCCDYRRLNEKIVRDHFPMPLIDDVLDKLQGAKVFTTLDLKNGFFHVPVALDSRKYTSFATHNGHKDEVEGIRKLESVLQVAAKNNLRIKWSKCQFLKRRVDFLGRFVEGYAVVAKPLSDLLCKDSKFILQDEQLVSFQQLKRALITAPVLKLYNPKTITEVHTDACMNGYGAVMLQKDVDDQELHPIQYMSRRTKPNEERFHSYELEALAIVEAVKKWRTYLLGIKFKIIKDCNAFALTLRKREVPPRVSRWALLLQDYDYSIEHRSGSRMKHEDALSRVSCLMLEDALIHRIRQAQLTDDWIRAVRKALE